MAGKYIGASEVGEFAYCKRAWKLASSGAEQVNERDRLRRGNEWHRKQGRNVHYSRRLRALAITAVVV